MDIFNFPKAVEQGVYDVMMWILFFPLTVVRMIFGPRRMLRYVREQSLVDSAEAYSEAMRPALFLAIAIIVGSYLSPDDLDELNKLSSSELSKTVYGSWASFTIFTVIALCLVPLVGALLLDLLTPGKINRESLRVPFEQQCYIGAPSILMLTFLMDRSSPLLGQTPTVLLAFAGCIWIIAVEYSYFRDNSELRPLVCLAMAFATLFGGGVLIVLAMLVVSGAPPAAMSP